MFDAPKSKSKSKPRPMLVIGLTGSIGMGKSTAAKILRRMGYPIYSADETVHSLLKKNGRAVKPVSKLFPDVVKRGAIDRKALGRAVFGDPTKLQALEAIIHPLMRNVEAAFVRKARMSKAKAAILEIPLLFETGAENRCDKVLCVTAPRTVQHKRVLSRPTMTPERLRAILKRQMPDKDKRARADFVIPTGVSTIATTRHLRAAMVALKVYPCR